LHCQDIECIRDALAVGYFARMEAVPDLPWVQLQTRLLAKAESKTQRVRVDKVLWPWRQMVAFDRPRAPESSAYMWNRWWAEVGRASSPENAGIVHMVQPETMGEVLRQSIWYNPPLEIRNGVGASMWTR